MRDGFLRAMTYNIHGGRDPLNRPSLDGIAATIKAAEADLVGLQEVERHFRGRTDQAAFLAAAAMSPAARPNFRKSSSGAPDSPNTSFRPTRSTGTGCRSLNTSQTALPKPPCTWCSSTVSRARVSAVQRTMVSTSMGLTVETLTTRAEMPRWAKSSAARSRVIDSALSPGRRLAFASPSVT